MPAELVQFQEPRCAPGQKRVNVLAGGLNSSDQQRADGVLGARTEGPYVIGGEGVGHLENGERVYFGHSVRPWGSWCETTLVDEREIWPIPDDLPADQAIALGISGTGALIPLEEARIQQGERVLILGATGPLGQIALQLARLMGAGTVVAAARNMAALERVRERGWAQEIAQIGTTDDIASLGAVAGEGFDVVLDIVYGTPAEAALLNTRKFARIMSIGVQAGPTMTIALKDLAYRTHYGVGTGRRPVEERKAAFYRLVARAIAGELTVDTVAYALEDGPAAWADQAASPHAKIYVRP
ncbi:zinc-binding alcohol dehydrogenase family protein [Sphingobium sp. Sx8-8]|uniref:quinone oxidoreductase family protein n=1 Tax=Sphingobium sp. Sx8-8 TaxID=2933617 RepID=UPI001F55D62E|nr:zinc-binding alcohol dehydrogenase family protein [Sphingobium sp. Sx8-8]